MSEQRISKEKYYIEIAKTIAMRSPCKARRQFGVIIVKNDAIVSTGYCGPSRGCVNCGIDIPCMRAVKKEAKNVNYNYYPSVHAEMNAIINASRNGTSIIGGTMYLAPCNTNKGDAPCYLCRRMIINVGLKDCWFINENGILEHVEVLEWIEKENEWIKNQSSNAN